ncbi:class I SAM-dependent methyltransferase [Gimesia algae]|uniref:Trans-aconitate 2-methyltransferase n=1 Tax=Gimesia algae TaxID=2527971 RepID=A0A517V690_9PLAN|nr:methyltransferase domain-containing protein [Gimesia algae]QDT88503.1 Trans-aconitate 2-methyltransferase [Gimesia algae]
MKHPLLTNSELEWSDVAANSRMNREREITGTNSYTADLKLNPLDFLMTRARTHSTVRWLDLCCGSGRALIQADEYFRAQQQSIQILGIDLVDLFQPVEDSTSTLKLETASLHDWTTSKKYDLITCVHGLHYVGDKLKLIADAASWLKADGTCITHLDLANLQSSTSNWSDREKRVFLQRYQLDYNPRRHTLTCQGYQTIEFPCRYLGASDQAGPNFTGQPAVHSVYELLDDSDRE